MNAEEEYIKRILAIQKNSDNTDDMMALEFALASARKRVPVKATMAYCCPSCGHMIMQEQSYCDQCGQAFDWGDD